MLSLIISGIKRQIRLATLKIVKGTLGGVFVLAGLGYFLAAFYIWLADRYDPITACLYIGGGLVVVGILLLLWANSGGKKTEKVEVRMEPGTYPPPAAGEREATRMSGNPGALSMAEAFVSGFRSGMRK